MVIVLWTQWFVQKLMSNDKFQPQEVKNSFVQEVNKTSRK